MKIKLTIGFIFAAIFVFLLSSQVAFVQAQQNNNPPPITIPITFPSFKISGNVSLRALNRFIPLPGVNIEAWTIVSKVRIGYFAQTDVSGNYLLTLPMGYYQVSPQSSSSIFFAPPKRFVNANKNQSNISFLGILRFR